MNTILFALKLLIASNISPTFVDRVEDNNVAVVCSADACATVPTVRKHGGLREGQAIDGCETVKRGDGTSAVVCGGSVRAFIGMDGTRHANPYAVPAADDCAVY